MRCDICLGILLRYHSLPLRRRDVSIEVPADWSIREVVLEQIDDNFMLGWMEGLCIL